jgi:tRNA dimethylallyltransferase
MRAVLNTLAKEAGPAWLYSKLELIDPQAAAIIDYRNTRRTIRALEVIFKTGYRFSEQRNKKPPFFDSILIGLDLPRDELYARVDARIEEMIRMGLVDEVQELVEMGYEQQLSKVAAIGYGELLGYLKGDYDLEEAIRLIKRNTRIFIRRQGNWFKKSDPRIKWFNTDAEVVNEISDYLQTELKTARN